MFKRIWKVVHPLLTLAAVGCCVYLLLRPTQSARDAAHADHTLRHFLQVKQLGGNAELPDDVHHCVVTLFVYTDGELDHRISWTEFSPNGGSRVIPYTVMWGRATDGVRGVTVGASGFTAGSDAFWATFDGPDCGVFGKTDLGEIQGYRIIGHAASRQCRPGKEGLEGVTTGDPQKVITFRKHVLFLGYKPFMTEKEAHEYASGDGILNDLKVR